MKNRSPDYPGDVDYFNTVERWVAKPLPPDVGWTKLAATSGEDAEISPPFENNWKHAQLGASAAAGWWTSDSGEVRMRGRIYDGTIGTTAVRLPFEVRPQFPQSFAVSVDASGIVDLSNVRFRSYILNASGGGF